MAMQSVNRDGFIQRVELVIANNRDGKKMLYDIVPKENVETEGMSSGSPHDDKLSSSNGIVKYLNKGDTENTIYIKDGVKSDGTSVNFA